MDINTLIKRVNNAYAFLSNIRAAGEELDRLAMARQELRDVMRELNHAKEKEKEGDNAT